MLDEILLWIEKQDYVNMHVLMQEYVMEQLWWHKLTQYVSDCIYLFMVDP